MTNISQLYHLTKPGIIRGNIFTATAGFLMATNGYINLWLYLSAVSGLALVIACGCVLNNITDKDIDKKMQRTKKRALVTGIVSVRGAVAYATLLGLIGSAILGFYTNLLTTTIAIIGLFFYVVVYAVAKRGTVHGTVVGSISGAIPPVVGYTAQSGRLDLGALLLFLILVCWQMPHFYAIALYRLKDYTRAGIPVLPAVKGIVQTKLQILLYIWAFLVSVAALGLAGYVRPVVAGLVLIFGLMWLSLGLKGYQAKDTDAWAKSMFGFSLLVLTSFCVSVSLDAAFV